VFAKQCLGGVFGNLVEVISRDSVSLSADLKNEYLDFARQHDWKESNNSVFRVNTAESYEALNLKSNGKNKYAKSRYSFFKSALRLTLSRLITSTVSNSKL
jgi:hypothetical protein